VIETLLHAADDLIEADVAVLEDDVQVAVCLGPDEHHPGYDRVDVMLERAGACPADGTAPGA